MATSDELRQRLELLWRQAYALGYKDGEESTRDASARQHECERIKRLDVDDLIKGMRNGDSE